MKSVTTLCLAFLAALPAAAAENEKANPAKAIAPFLDEQTIAVARVRVADIDVDAVAAEVSKSAGISPEQITRGKNLIGKWVADFNRAGGKDLYVVFSLADLPQNPPFVIVPLAQGADADDIAALLRGPRAATGGEAPRPSAALLLPYDVAEKIDDVVFAGTKAARKRLRTLKPAPRPDVAKAFTAVDASTIQALLLPSDDARRILEEALPTLPQQAGGGSSKVITRGITWAALGVNTQPDISLRVVVQSRDADAAGDLEKLITTNLKNLSRQEGLRKAFPNLDQLLDRLTPKVTDDRLTLELGHKTLAEVLLPAVARARAAADRSLSMNKLKQIGLALHNYHDTYRAFPPPARCDKDGKPLLSWRVLILPFVEQDNLYKQFHLDEPWDSEHNKKLIARMPELYRSSPTLRGGKTTFLGVAGEKAMFHGCKGVGIADVTDGTSNTIFVVDAADDRAVVWTKPDDYEYDEKDPIAGLVGHYPNAFLALIADGSVRLIEKTIDPKTLNALFTRNGGEAVNFP